MIGCNKRKSHNLNCDWQEQICIRLLFHNIVDVYWKHNPEILFNIISRMSHSEFPHRSVPSRLKLNFNSTASLSQNNSLNTRAQT
jgi:hypothetical protein